MAIPVAMNRKTKHICGGVPARVNIASIALAGAVFSLIRHRLFWRYCNFLAKMMPFRQYSCVVQLDPNSGMKVFLDDPYWSRLIARTYKYESDLEHQLLALQELDFVFLDCGANFGYWSILLSSPAFGNRQTLAIEASPNTYTVLGENCELNQSRFSCLNNALSDVSGNCVRIVNSSGHAGAHVDLDAIEGEPVYTITIDEALLEKFGKLPERLLIKLDVEGQEIPALKGAKLALKQDVLIYYEDHGKDSSCAVTEFVLKHLGLRVFFVTEQLGNVTEIQAVEDVRKIKKQKSKGYNFFACREGSTFLSGFGSV